MTETVELKARETRDRRLTDPTTKYALATRPVPLGELCGVREFGGSPSVGDLALARVTSVGKNRRIEAREGFTLDLFEGDHVVGVFGNRYATGQFEGYVPKGAVGECDLISVGGVLGVVLSKHSQTAAPTKVEVAGALTDAAGRPLNLRDFGSAKRRAGRERGSSRQVEKGGAEVVLVVGSSMDSGKTTTAGTLARSLGRAGFRVAAAKVTGTATGKDTRFFRANGAYPVLDFVDAGYPSTFMISEPETLDVYASLVERLAESEPDYIVLEIADGIFQRETRMLLASDAVRRSVDHVFFAAGDALAAAHGVARVRELGYPVRATSGAVAASELGVRETEELSSLPCLSLQRILSAELREVLRRPGGAGLKVGPAAPAKSEQTSLRIA